MVLKVFFGIRFTRNRINPSGACNVYLRFPLLAFLTKHKPLLSPDS